MLIIKFIKCKSCSKFMLSFNYTQQLDVPPNFIDVLSNFYMAMSWRTGNGRRK
jgi:hypothetical protein